MENTGERHILSENFTSTAALFNHLMHIATYNYALNYAKGKRVLDFGCGSGYGSYELAKVAKYVTAVDISSEAIEFAKENYKRENLLYCTISELFEEKFDIITSFQVIEHVSNDKEYLENLKNLLIPGGYLFISTPDKASRLFFGIQKPWNIFHLKEYSVGE